MMDFLVVLRERLNSAKKNARRNYYSAYFCYAVAIAASVSATVAAAMSVLPKAALAMLTAIPGAALLVNSVLSFDRKATWYWRKVRCYESMLMAVQFEGKNVSLASAER